MPRLTAAQRAAIIADLDKYELSQGAIAKKHGVTQSAVSKIAKAHNPNASMDAVAKTREATEARRAADEAKHADFTDKLLDDAITTRRVLMSIIMDDVQARVNGTNSPDPQGTKARNYATVLGIQTDKYRSMRELQVPHGVEDNKSLLAEMMDDIRRRARDLG